MAELNTVEISDDPKILAALAKIPCPGCGEHSLVMETRIGPLKFNPVGKFSIAGAQMKLTATVEAEAFLKCSKCSFEKKGHR